MLKILQILTLVILSIGIIADLDAQVVVRQAQGADGSRVLTGSTNAYGSNYWLYGRSIDMAIGMAPIQQELDLDERQIAKLKKLQTDFRAKQRDIYAELKDIAPKERTAFLQEMLTTIRENLRSDVEKVLLPLQKKRLDQIVFRSKLKGGVQMVIRDEGFLEMLDITDEQKAKLSKRMSEEQRKMYAELQRMRQELEKKVLQEILTGKQLKKIEELSGEEFAPKQNSNFRVLTNNEESKN